MTSIDTTITKTTEADRLLLEKAFATSPDASQVVIRVKPSKSSSSPPPKVIWQDYALYLENQDSDRLKKSQQRVKIENENSNKTTHLSDSAHPRISLWDRSNLSPVNLLTSRLDYVLCAHCKKPLLSEALQYHVDLVCPKINRDTSSYKQELKLANGTTKKRKWSETHSSTSSPNPEDLQSTDGEVTPKKIKKTYNKKQKLANISDSTINRDTLSLETPSGDTTPDKKARKLKKEKTSKPIKVKAPVDVERQCGVALPTGGLCARSLTCKTHSMGAKRAVQGRSAPYDVLLAQYQRKNQVKLASLSTAQQLADENEALGGSPLNPDEEVQQVMEGVQRAYAIPLDRAVIFPTRLKSQFFRMREMFANALLPKGSPPGIGRILGRASAFNPETPSTLHFVRPPALQRTAYLASLRQQQQQQLQQQQSNAVTPTATAPQPQRMITTVPTPQSRQGSPPTPR